MTHKLHVADGIPPAVLGQHTAVLGKTGSGKTTTAKLLVEQVVAAGARVCVLDPIKSDWWGMTLAADGLQRGLPFQILGGPRGHVTLHSAAGKAVAEVVASGALPHSIIDMANFPAGGIAQFFTDFAPVLLQKMRGVLYLVVEEAHEFAPKERSGIGQENMAIHFAKRLAVAGRSKGIRLVILTQRTQALHNALLGSCDTVVAHRLTAPADQEPVVKWLRANTDKQTVAKVAESLSSLKTGEGWLCSGEAQIFERRKFPRIGTFDNSATPVDGQYREVDVPPVDVEALKSLIGSAVAEAEASDPRRLKEEVTKLRAQVQRLTAQPPPVSARQPAAIPHPHGAKNVTTDEKLDKLIDLMGRQQVAPAPALPPNPAGHHQGNGRGDEELLYQRFKARLLSEVSLGVASITVTPPEKLRKDFQTEEAGRIVAAVQALDPLAKRVLKLLEGVGGHLPQKQIAERLGRSTGGGSWVALTQQVKELASAGLVVIDGKRGVATSTRAKISTDLASYQPTDDEVEAVYQSVLYQIATGEE